MKLKLLLLSTLFSTLTALTQNKEVDKIETLKNDHQYYKLKKAADKLKDSKKYYYLAYYYNVTNNPEVSLKYIDTLRLKQPQRNDLKLWSLINDNAVKLFDYKLAFESQEYILNTFKENLSQKDLKDAQTKRLIWQQLVDFEPQKVIFNKEVERFTSKKDLAGLLTLPVKAGNDSIDFVFDTGAGLNVVNSEMAEKLNFTILPDVGIQIQSFTGNYTKVRIAIAPEIYIGSVKIENSPFLVYNAKELIFANGAYVIKGIIGFPIAKELGSIVYSDTKITLNQMHKNYKIKDKNLFLEELRGVVMLGYKGQVKPYNLDTGANHTILSKPFYTNYTKNLGKVKTVTKEFEGAGNGINNKQLIELIKPVFTLGKYKITLDKINLDANEIDVYGPNNYGNIGQDFFKNYNEVVISFKGNYIELN